MPDNNVLGRAHPRAQGPARRLLNLLSSESHAIIVSRPMIEELERILAYPRMRKRSGLSNMEIADYLGDLARRAALVVPESVPQGLLRDSSDEPILGTALAGNADILCTRDRHFWDEQVLAFAAGHGIRIMTDLELLAFLDEQDSQPVQEQQG